MKKRLHNISVCYRHLLYHLCGRSESGVLTSWVPCQVEDPKVEQTFGDIVHPCVRFIEEGFEGHQWWMAYTPYYGGNAEMENPRLCYSEASDGGLPTVWKYYCTIKDKPKEGYNSDPTMLFNEGRLYVYWRENYTQATYALGMSRATFGCYVENQQVHYLKEAQLQDLYRNKDKEVCPTFLSYRGKPRAYAMDIRFCSKMMYHLSAKMARRVYRLLDYTEKLGLYSRFRCHGVSIWEGDSFEGKFKYMWTVRFRGRNHLYQPWHMDLFFQPNDESKLFAVIQSSINRPDICLAKSEDGERFRLFHKPLITSQSIGMKGLYKPSAVVAGNELYLFFTARDNDNPMLNRLFVAPIAWDELLNRVNAGKK
jgi:hypothetical protein